MSPSFNTGVLIHDARNLSVDVVPVEANGSVLLRLVNHPNCVTLADTPDGLSSLLSAALDAITDSQGGVEGTEATCTRCFRKVTLRRPTPEELESHNKLELPTPRITDGRPIWADHLPDSIPFYCDYDKLHAVHEDDD